jgi:hypothetical protein
MCVVNEQGLARKRLPDCAGPVFIFNSITAGSNLTAENAMHAKKERQGGSNACA